MAGTKIKADRPAGKPTFEEQHTAERVLRHGARHCETGKYLTHRDLVSLVALIDRLQGIIRSQGS